MMATVPHVISGLRLRKFQADGFLFTRMYNRIQQFCVCKWHNNVIGIKKTRISDKQTWGIPQLSNDTTGSYPRSKSTGEIFMSGLHCITFRIYIILFNSNSSLVEMLQLVKLRTPAGRLNFDSRQELLLNLTTCQQALRHLFSNLLVTVKLSPIGWSEEVKTIEASLLKTNHYHVPFQDTWIN